MRFWISTLLLALIAAVGKWGPRFVVGSESARKSSMEFLAGVDEFFRNSWSPTLVVIGVAGLITILLIAPATRLFLEKWFGTKIREFNSQFTDEAHQKVRNNLAWFLEGAYRRHANDMKGRSLRNEIDALAFPEGFPPSGDENIHDYALGINWPDSQSEKLFSFFRSLFVGLLEQTKEIDHLSFDKPTDLADCIRIVGQFWDHWAREISEGRLRYNAVQRQIEANQRGIKALALCELAIAAEFSWDPGPGRTYLFRLALGEDHIKPRSLYERLRCCRDGTR